MVKVMIVDDQIILSEGIKSILEASKKIEVVACATDGVDALERLESIAVDVVLMDIRMPKMNGVVATERIKSKYPDIKVLMLTTFDDSDFILDAISNGANGYLLKDVGSEVLVDSILKANEGDTILPTRIAQKITSAAKKVTTDREIRLKRAFKFSDRETEIAIMIYEGFSNKQISTALKISEGTTRNYISTIYAKLNCNSRMHAKQIMRDAVSAAE